MAGLSPVILALTAAGGETARAIARALGAETRGRAGRVEGADADFRDARAEIAALFAAGRPIVGVCAAGVLIRAVAPLLSDKRAEPPVIAVAEDGSAVVPLLGGHRGANALARRIGVALGAQAAITTAGDLRFGVALDEPPQGWVLENPEAAKAVSAALLAGATPRLFGEADWLAPLGAVPGGGAPGCDAALGAEGAAETLRYHRRRVMVGVGCARNCPPREAVDLVRAALADAGVAPGAVAAVGSLDLKADEAAVHAVAADLGAEARFFTADALSAERPRLANPSDVVFAEVGCHGVCEGAALALAGPMGTLIAPKRKTAMATAALALAPSPVPAPAGRRRGRVSLVGIGPGRADARTPEASRLIAEADELVGYGLYIDLLGAAAAGKPRADFPLGGEEARCRHALERAGEGADVALICSGDAGIYAMGALVFELLDRAPDQAGVSDAARRVEVVSAPGVSALQSAAALAGAPLGHDFCAISLSDLLTPREAILSRLAAAAQGDFVIAFYNPVSKTRRTLLAEARRILLAHRPAETPVLLGSSLGRPEEKIVYRRLDALEVDDVDMLTVVIVGSSQSRLVQRGEGPRMYTPRGYARKLDAPGWRAKGASS